MVIFPDRKSTRLNSSHLVISYAVFCLKKKMCVAIDALSHMELQHHHCTQSLNRRGRLSRFHEMPPVKSCPSAHIVGRAVSCALVHHDKKKGHSMEFGW